MPIDPPVRARREFRSRSLLLAGASASAITVGLAAPASAAAPRPLSPAWFAAHVDASVGAAAAGTPLATLTAQSTATHNLATITARLAQMEAAELAAATSARAANQASGAIPNGLVPGGLELVPGTTAGTPAWSGANLPTQTTSGTETDVTITQTTPQAVVTWQNFNVGARTALSFDQSAGNSGASNWVVLNRVEGSATIQGSITAPGKVYILDGNGILFAGGSTVDVGALIASTAAITDAQFATGIYGPQSQKDPSTFLPSFTGATAPVTVQLGAAITTNSPASIAAGGGYVMLLGSTVENDGEIQTPEGQTVLAAGQDFVLRAGYSTDANQTATVQGSQVATTGHGNATNDGVIVSTLGDVTLAGQEVTQNGAAVSSSSVDTRGTVHLLTDDTDDNTSVTLGPNSVTVVNPDNSATTALDSQRASLIAQSATNNALRVAPSATNPQLDDVSTLPDQLDQGRVEIVTGGTTAFDGGSVTMSQGGQIAIQAGRRVWVGDGAALDVSGSTAAVLPMSSNTVVVNIQGNELRDAPVNRDTGLIASNNVTVDTRDLVSVAAGVGGDPSARLYTPGGLLEVSGYLSNTGHTIDEWAAVGGTITVATDEAITQPGADLNVAGGAVSVQGGAIGQSYLVGPDGNLYNVNTAPANIPYLGVYGGFVVDQARWGVVDTYLNPLAAPAAITQNGYFYGRDAGSVVIGAPTAVLEGTIEAGAINGPQQTAVRPAGVTDPYTYAQSAIALPGTLALGGYTPALALLDPRVTISPAVTPIAAGIAADTALPAGTQDTIALSASLLDAAALGGLSVLTSATIDVTGPVTLAPGGTLSLTGSLINIGAALSARGGRIAIGDITALGAATSVLPAKNGKGGVTLGPGASIDLRGEFTNAALNPGLVSGEGLVNGGALAIDSGAALLVGAGTVIDASSGAAVLPGGKTRGGAGGSVTLIGDDPFYQGVPAAVTIQPTLVDDGVNGGGTLTLTAPRVLVAVNGVATEANTAVLAPSVFMTGFSDYVVNGVDSLAVAPGTAITVVEPVYSFIPNGSSNPIDAPTGEAPAQALPLILPPSYIENQTTGRLTQRQGASLAFISNDRPGDTDLGGGPITIGAGAAITVDPGQSVRIEAYGQVTDDGAITAPGGQVGIFNEQVDLLPSDQVLAESQNLSIWIGGDASIDVAGLATTALDSFGRPYGAVLAGGTITIGGTGSLDTSNSRTETDAQVLIRPGAVLDASGAAAIVDLLAGTAAPVSLENGPAPTDPVLDATGGGTISLGSDTGISVEGALEAASGGIGATGGTLSMTLETPVYGTGVVVPDQLRLARVLTIAEVTPAVGPDDAALQPGQRIPHPFYANAAISAQQLTDGGFGSASLYARGAIVFDGTVDLTLSDSIALEQGIIADSSTSGVVTVSAATVALSGNTPLANQNGGYSPQIGETNWHPFNNASGATLAVTAALIDVGNDVRFGVSTQLPLTVAGRVNDYNLPGFGLVTLDSSGDLRFGTGSLTTPGDLDLTAAQLYPTTGAVMSIFAGYNQYRNNDAPPNLYLTNGTITIATGGAAVAAAPYSVGGTLSLYAGRIEQGGVIRAPEGTITLGSVGVGPSGLEGGENPFTSHSYAVDLLPGSVTSVSLNGQNVPYGGTVDGVTYTYNGAAVGTFDPSITLAGAVQTVDAGALLDLSGGGTLSGAGFITGRGGSTDVLTTPLLQFDAAAGSLYAPTLASAPVYAIVPGYASAYAPVSPVEATGGYGSVPGIGQQITIGAGVPGVAPGTYTLLPSYFALLPGAARVQINLGQRTSVPGVTTLGAGSYELNATRSVANTGSAAAVPVEVIVTTSAGVALNSQYNQEDYSSYELAQAADYSTPRGSLPADGKTLNLMYPQQGSSVTGLDYAGTALFGAAAGGRGGQATVGDPGDLEITADGATPTQHFTAIEASALDALGASRLVIGGHLVGDPSRHSLLDFVGDTDQVAVRGGAVLTAPEIYLVTLSPLGGSASDGAITVADGAVLDTVGAGAPPTDSSAGFFYNPNGTSLVALSNGNLIFAADPTQTQGLGAITIEDGATLLTTGTLNFVTQTSLVLGTLANYGAQSLGLNLNTVNIVGTLSPNSGPVMVPAGFILTQDVLDALLRGDPSAGVPGLQSLVLTANQSINLAGSVALDTTGQGPQASLVLNTPAIYGYGVAGDTATITTGTLYWNGIRTITRTGTTITDGSALPGGMVANAPTVGLGTLDIVAQNIVLGYGPNTAPDDQTTLNRVIEGFATVNLSAAGSISGADRGTLSVYQTAGAVPGGAGTGGTLNIVTPLLTGAAGSVDSIVAGGAVTVSLPGGAAGSAATAGPLGATLSLVGASVNDDSTILLNAGQLTLLALGTSAGDVTIGPDARIDLAGRSVTLVDQIETAGGGSLVLGAANGNVSADAGSSIDVSAVGAAAGSVTVSAVNGTVALDGAIAGGSSAGQTSASFTLRAGTLPDFAALNTALDTGQVFGSRSFEIGTGDLTVAQTETVTAHDVSINVDGGTLTIDGTIQAGGAAPGAIALSAGGDLVIADGAVLNAAGTVPQTDSNQAAIDAENRATVSLTTNGTLDLGAATIDVSAPVASPLGVVDLIAPQVANNGVYDDISINVTTGISITGAETVALYGSRIFYATDRNGTIEQTRDPTIPGSLSLDQISAENAAFLTMAAANTSLGARILPLISTNPGAFHLRPADTIEAANASGNLTVTGDLDLSVLRYGAPMGAPAGAGEVGLLTLRAANTLTVNGSISDGFATPPDAASPTPDDNGWVLYSTEPLGQAVTLPKNLQSPVVLENGTTISTATPVALNYAITIASATLKPDVVIPTPVTTAQNYTIPAGGFTTTAAITEPGGTTIPAGTVLAQGTQIPRGSMLAKNSVLPFEVQIAKGTAWPAYANLDAFADQTVTLDMPKQGNQPGTLTLPGGAYIPAGSSLTFPNFKSSVKIRPLNANGVQGLVYAIAPMLPAGSQSWSINLVGGADVHSADLLALQPRTALADVPGGPIDPAGSVVLSDTHYTDPKGAQGPTDSFSVIRTGTGTLNVVAGGNVDEASLYGIYTAGTQTDAGSAYQLARAPQADGTVLGRANAAYNAVIADYQAYYPSGGGDVVVAAQNSVTGDVLGGGNFNTSIVGTDNVGGWLWRQGGSLIGQNTAWWINFGSYVLPLNPDGGTAGSTQPILTGFTGIGALGGGNVTVRAGGNAGEITTLPRPGNPVSQGLVIAVASTGRVIATTVGGVTTDTTALTGGGLLTLDVGGTLNPATQALGSPYDGLGGTLTDMRGDIDVNAGQVGRIDLVYGAINNTDPRPQDPFTTPFATASNGLIVVPGDGSVTIDTLRDLVLAGAGDAGRMPEQSLTAIDPMYLPGHGKTLFGGDTGFSLWTGDTAIDLFSDGGNLTPTTGAADNVPQESTPLNDAATDYRFIYPGTLQAVAASGSFYYGQNGIGASVSRDYSLELAPSATGQLSFIAAQSIYANSYAVDMSGANAGVNALPNPYNPAYEDASGNLQIKGEIYNILADAGNVPSPDALFAFEADTPTSDLHALDPTPARFYAASGDLLDFQYGEALVYPTADNLGTWYLSAKPAWIVAGRDIISAGTRPAFYPQTIYPQSTFGTFPNETTPGPAGALSSGNVLLNVDPTAISLVSAGRDILSSYFYVAGPGLLEVDAGRNIDETGNAHLDYGVLKSIGPIIDVNAADRSGGAGIAVLAGASGPGVQYTAFADLYFNDANAANLMLPLTDPANVGKVQQTYQQALYAWLQSNFGYTGTEADALAAFDTLSPLDQAVFVRSVFYDELLASGRQHSDPASLFYGSYARGRTAIKTLFTTDTNGNPVGYAGNITMDSGHLAGIFTNAPIPTLAVFDAGISTLAGGSVQLLTPGGTDILGIAGGPTPGPNSGVITFGSGDIDVFALGSVLLGQSRIFTTFGGSILIWSATGDINAGRGAKTTTVEQPQLIDYDSFGDVTLSPSAPTAGAGIATLTPIAGTTPGDVDLIAPEGTVDAGEAGIRVSGNLNIAALIVVNAANVQVGGHTAGNTAVASVNTAAATAVSNVAGSSVNASTQDAANTRRQQAAQTPSVITVQILGDSDAGDEQDQRRRLRPAA